MAKPKPNILFIVMDDVGVDQMRIFGYGGVDAPSLPSIDTLAKAGVMFRNAWAMPTCSTTRATFFDGRYPFRTNVLNAITASDLANSQVSPYEATTPKLLKTAGYENAVIGKMHLSGTNLNPDNNPLGNGVMHTLGWDYFAGFLDGGPYPIDTTAGGVGTEGQFSCGFVPTSASNGDHGACRHNDAGHSCQDIASDNPDTPIPGLSCLQSGGIFEPGKACSDATGSVNFSTQNGYYTGELIINDENGNVQEFPPSDPMARKYRSTLETDLARDWINTRSGAKPWMLSLGYSAVHSPLQPPPANLLKNGDTTEQVDCDSIGKERKLSNQILEVMDKEIGRLLVSTGLAFDAGAGRIRINPSSNTYIVIIGDNGTYAPTVKLPFDPERAKGTAYQGGVWVPLVIAGPDIATPDRSVGGMVNSADLYALFAEIAGVNYSKQVPRARAVDAHPMLKFLKSANYAGERKTNFTEMGTNLRKEGVIVYPCVIRSVSTCTQIFPQQKLCEDEGGDWYGPNGEATPEGLTSCCQVNKWLSDHSQTTVEILPDIQRAIRNANYKLVELVSPNCSAEGQQVGTTTSQELYRINQAVPFPKLDGARSNLLARPSLLPEARANYDALKLELKRLLASEPACPGDGNRDGKVDATDLQQWARFAAPDAGMSSWYDFNLDGLTDEADRSVILSNFGKKCN